MPLDLTLLVIDEDTFRLLNVTGLSVESNESLSGELENFLDSGTEAMVVGKIAWHLYGEYPGTSWTVRIIYALDGRSDGRLTYTAPGDGGEGVQSTSSPSVGVSRYNRKPVI